ncbi:MAG: type II secretion system F family protein, partial [Deltaproteobacteria bacterium]
MIRAGVPILKMLRVLENQTENVALRDMITEIYSDIEKGSSLHDAFSKHPRAFSPLYCSMLRAGEASGALPEIMDRLIYILEHEHKVKSDIKSAFQYPIIVVAFLLVAFFILLTFVVPKFVGIFSRANIDLPLPTVICMVMYQFLVNFWPILLLALVAGFVFLRYYLRTDQGKFAKDAFLMRLPLLGPLFAKTAMARFASIFSILQASGVPVLA